MTKYSRKLRPGDLVQMRTSRLPTVSSFKAAVEATGEGQFSVFSAQILESGLPPVDLVFDEDGGDFQILRHQAAVDAVPVESGGFAQGARVRLTWPDELGELLEGRLVAAVDGLLYAVTDEGVDFSASRAFFELVPQR